MCGTAVGRSTVVGSVPKLDNGLEQQCRQEEHNAHYVPYGTFIFKYCKANKESGCLSCCGGEGHGKRSKIFGNGSRTGRSKESHGGKENNDTNFHVRRPIEAPLFGWEIDFSVGTRFGEEFQSEPQVSLECGSQGNCTKGNRVHVKNKFILSYTKFVHNAFAHVGDGSVAQ